MAYAIREGRAYWAGQPIDADAASLVPLSRHCARDAHRLWAHGRPCRGLTSSAEVLFDAALDSRVIVAELTLTIAREGERVSLLVPEADPIELSGIDASSFVVLSECFACDRDHVYRHELAWIRAGCGMAVIGPSLDDRSARVLQERCGTPFNGVLGALPGVDPSSFKVFDAAPFLARDRAHVYCYAFDAERYVSEVLVRRGLDAETCAVLPPEPSAKRADGVLLARARDARGAHDIVAFDTQHTLVISVVSEDGRTIDALPVPP